MGRVVDYDYIDLHPVLVYDLKEDSRCKNIMLSELKNNKESDKLRL